MNNTRFVTEPTLYAGRDITVAICERLGVPLLIVNEHGDTVILRGTADL